MSWSVKMGMFFLSFIPLWISILFIDIKSICESKSSVITECFCVCAIVIGFVVSFVLWLFEHKSENQKGGSKYSIVEVNEEKSITSEFLLSYILPLLAFDFREWSQVVLFLIYFLFLGYLCIRHNHLCANIFLVLLGYRIYRCSLEEANEEKDDNIIIEETIISKEKLINHKTETIFIWRLNNEFSRDLTRWKK